jgi:general secretion pathway protein K
MAYRIPIEKRLNSRDGIVLFIVLWVLTLLSMIVSAFCYEMKTEVNTTRNFKEQTQAHYIAHAGFTMAITELIEGPITPQRMTENAEQADEKKPPLRINADNPEVPFGEGEYGIHIDNESGKININFAGDELLRVLFRQFKLTETELDTIVDSILDWRDEDHLHRLHGAEDDYYRSLPEPYQCRDGFFDSPEELMLVRGISKEMYYGGLKGLVSVFVPPSPFDASELNKQTRAAYILREKKKQYKGPDFDHLNPNAASVEMLLLMHEMTPEDVNSILAYRKQKDLKTVEELRGLINPDAFKSALKFFRFHLIPYYTIRAVGYVDEKRTRDEIVGFIEINPKLEKKFKILSMHEM